MPCPAPLRIAMALTVGTLAGSPATGAEPPPENALYYENVTALRYNPLGLQEEFLIGWRKRLLDKEPDDLLFGNTYLWTGPTVRASPQFLTAGGFFKLVPIALLELTATGERVVAIDDGKDMVDGTDDLFDEGTLRQAGLAGRIIQDGWILSFTGRLQGKVGPVAVRNTALMRKFALDIPGDALFYDQTLDVVTAGSSWVLQNDTDLIFKPDDVPWLVGVRYTYTNPFIDDGFSIQRVGPVVAWTFDEKNPGGGFNRPTLLMLSQWHVEHEWRTGDPVSQGLPYLVLAFAFNGILVE